MLNTSAHGPYGAAQFYATTSQHAGTVFDRTQPTNPFKDDSFVLVPYCTGDVHAGSVDRTYTSGQSSATVHHAGRSNDAAGFQTALGELTATVLDPLPQWRYFVVMGDSHTMLGAPGSFSQGGVGLWDFLGLQVSGDPAWASVAP